MIHAIVLGPPGSGKGSVAKLICQAYNIPHISTGDMFREAIASNTNIGKIAASFIHEGHFVPDDVTIEIVKQRILQPDCAHGFLFDGFPRTLPQAEALDQLLKTLQRPLTIVIDLACDEPELIRRIAGRLVCPTCGSSYQVDTVKPRVAGVCDLDATTLVQRKDDNLEAFAIRTKAYQDLTLPLIGFYKAKGLLKLFDGDQPTVDLFEDVKQALQGQQ
jgi:adenylate kinase